MNKVCKKVNHQYWLGKKRDPRTIEKMRLSNLGRKNTEETKEKMRQSHLKRKNKFGRPKRGEHIVNPIPKKPIISFLRINGKIIKHA